MTASLIDVATRTRLGDPIDLGEQLRGYPSSDLAGNGLQAAFTLPTGRGVAVWDLNTDDWVQAACALAGRNLTKQEWDTYLGSLGEYHATCQQFPLPGT